jgi:hypothetical protein
MNPTVKVWLHGLGAAAIGGVATAITVLVLDPLKFNLGAEWLNVVKAALVSGIVNVAFYLKKSPLPGDTTAAGILVAVLGIAGILGFSGCSSIANMKAMTPEQRQAYALQVAKDWLSNPANQQSVKDVLVVGGIQALREAASDEDRGTIANYMWASAAATRTLMTGEVIAPDRFQALLTSVMKPSRSAQVAQYTAAVNLAWTQVYQRLSVVQDPSLAKAWLLVIVEAGETVGNAYRTVE